MRRSWLDSGTADRLLTGQVHPDDAPPGYASVAQLLREATAAATSEELRHETEALAAAAQLIRAELDPGTGPPFRGPRSVRSNFFRAKVMAVVIAGSLTSTAGLAAAGALPDAAQDAISDMLAKIGVSVPAGDEHPASIGSEISEIARTTDATGVDKGSQVSSEASGGTSQAGEHGPAGSPSDTHGQAGTEGPPMDTPNTVGTDTAHQASGGSSESGTSLADEASQGHSEDGSGNAPGIPNPAPTLGGNGTPP